MSSDGPSSADGPMSADGDVVLRVENVGKQYQMVQNPLSRLRDRLLRRESAARWALRGASFELRRGEAFAIVGRNGSGKSTLLQLITGNLALTEGRIEVDGRVGALLELGSGFAPDFTGRENVRLQGVLLGLPPAAIERELLPRVAEFADIGEYFDQPVRTYSSGMFVRLAFAVQVQAEPDILIVDEALAVGDALFQKRCFRRMEEMQRKGVTLLFVSHDQETVRSLTQRALLLDAGEPKLLASSGEVLLAYRKLLHETERRYVADQIEVAEAAQQSRASTVGRLQFGDGGAEITGVELCDASGAPCRVFETGDPMTVRVHLRLDRAIDRLNVALRLRNRQGVKVYSWGTLNQDMAIAAGRAEGARFWERRFAAGEAVTVDFATDCRLGPDYYEVQAAVSREATPDYRNQQLLHWRDEAAFFQVTMAQDRWYFGGVFDLRMQARW